jgi:hypothetical protein
MQWLCFSLKMFFTDVCVHFNELNVKLQGLGKPVDVMFSIIIAFERKIKYMNVT